MGIVFVAEHILRFHPDVGDSFLAWIMIMLLLLGTFLLCLLVALWRAGQGLFKKNIRLCYPLLTWILVTLIVFSLPLKRLGVYMNYTLNSEDLQRVVEMVEAGEISSSGEYYTDLPEEFAHVSAIERVVIEKNGRTLIYFIVFPGLIDNHAGLMYRSDQSPPEEYDFGGRIINSHKVVDHWWWCGFT